MLYDYFPAPSDKFAASTLKRWGGGPGGISPVVETKGIEPYVTLGKLEEILTGRTRAEQTRIAVGGRGEQVVTRIGDDLMTAIASTHPDRFVDLSVRWSRIDEFHGRARPEELAEILRELKAVAAHAKATDQHIYCWRGL